MKNEFLIPIFTIQTLNQALIFGVDNLLPERSVNGLCSVCNSHKHKEANLKKKSRIPLCALSAALLVSLYIFFRKRVNCSRPPNSLIWRKTRPIHVLVVICRNCRREKSPYPNGRWCSGHLYTVQCAQCSDG